ncbi:hypothetical protein [Dinoroseobacter sp. S76]|uniref:hypothetical protein n=1 Tax=Dinoroseobacter sp. S76 TaxID=3415124 RepID=UPI003C7D20AF
MTRSVLIPTLAVLLLAACETTTPTGANAGTEQLRAQLAPAMRDADVPEACIQTLSLSALSAVKAAVSPGFGPRVTAGNVGLGNPRAQEKQRIQAIARRECPEIQQDGPAFLFPLAAPKSNTAP